MKLLPAFFFLFFLGTVLLGASALRAQVATPVVLTTATAPAGLRVALARQQAALASPLREALRTLPITKKRFQAGLPEGDQLLLSVLVQATDTSFRQASARVLGWRGGTIQALLLPNAVGAAEPLPVSFPETAVMDWTLLRASGREEGDYVGRHLTTTSQLERLPLR